MLRARICWAVAAPHTAAAVHAQGKGGEEACAVPKCMGWWGASSGLPGYVDAVQIPVREVKGAEGGPARPGRPSEFEAQNTLHQLRCGGVLEAVRISCAGYPTKQLYLDFVDHFWPLGPELLADEELEDHDVASLLLKKTGLQVPPPPPPPSTHSAHTHTALCSFPADVVSRIWSTSSTY